MSVELCTFMYNTFNIILDEGSIINIFLLLLLSSTLFCSEYPYFSEKELIDIKQKDPISMHRIVDYEKSVASLEHKSMTWQLNRVNSYLNQLLPQYDQVIYNQEDLWSTPKEFLRVGYGDCEDYAIIKYYTLIRLGFDKDKLYITRVTEKYKGGAHMVLTYFQKEGEAPLVLDNLSFKILTTKQRVDLDILYFINDTGVYTMSKTFKLTKVAKEHPKFEELQKKIQANK